MKKDIKLDQSSESKPLAVKRKKRKLRFDKILEKAIKEGKLKA